MERVQIVFSGSGGQGVVTASIILAEAAVLYDDLDGSRVVYGIRTRTGGKASLCTECGSCEEICPQGLPIIDLMKKAVEELE